MSAPFNSPMFNSFWRHPNHVRRCELASQNQLEKARARGLAKIRREEVVITLQMFGAGLLGSLAFVVVVYLTVRLAYAI